MKSLRRIIEKLVIDSFISSEKIDQLQFQVKNLSEETKSLQALVYEEEFKKLVFCISTPIKDRLCNEFRRNNIRIDPLDDDLLYAIYNKSSLTGISTTDMKTTMSIFKQVAGQVGLHEKELIKIILLQLERNVEEHEILKQYIKRCNRSRTKAEFLDLINYLNLNGLLKYKEVEIPILKKIFDYYVNEYY